VYYSSFFNIITFPLFFAWLPGAMLIFNLLYAHRLLRYYIGFEERRRAIRAGILGMAWSTLVLVILYATIATSTGEFVVTMPIPALFIGGLILMKFRDPASDIAGLVFDEEKIAEQEREPIIKKGYEDVVTVPVLVMISSFVKKALSRRHSNSQ
jgi:hypothetical protein